MLFIFFLEIKVLSQYSRGMDTIKRPSSVRMTISILQTPTHLTFFSHGTYQAGSHLTNKPLGDNINVSQPNYRDGKVNVHVSPKDKGHPLSGCPSDFSPTLDSPAMSKVEWQREVQLKVGVELATGLAYAALIITVPSGYMYTNVIIRVPFVFLVTSMLTAL